MRECKYLILAYIFDDSATRFFFEVSLPGVSQKSTLFHRGIRWWVVRHTHAIFPKSISLSLARRWII